MLLEILAAGEGDIGRRAQPVTYTGTGVARTLTTGVQLGTAGGLVWIKQRNTTEDHALFDTVRGIDKRVRYPATNQDTLSAISVGDKVLNLLSALYNDNLFPYVAWLFRKTLHVFTVVEIPAEAGATVAHDLGATPGAVILFRRTGSAGGHGKILHREQGPFGDNTTLTHGVSTAGSSWVGFLFAHDQSRVDCIEYVGTGEGVEQVVPLSFAPIWVLMARSEQSGPFPISLADAVIGDEVRNPELLRGQPLAEGGAGGHSMVIDGAALRVTGESNVLDKHFFVIAAR